MSTTLEQIPSHYTVNKVYCYRESKRVQVLLSNDRLFDSQYLLELIQASSDNDKFVEEMKQDATIDTKLCELLHSGDATCAIFALQLLLQVYREQIVVVLKIHSVSMDTVTKAIANGMKSGNVHALLFSCFCFRTLFDTYLMISTPKLVPEFIESIAEQNAFQTLVEKLGERTDCYSNYEMESILATVANISLFVPQLALSVGAVEASLQFISTESSLVNEKALSVVANICQALDEVSRVHIAQSAVPAIVKRYQQSVHFTLEELDTSLQLLGSLFMSQKVYELFQERNSVEAIMNQVVIDGMMSFCSSDESKLSEKKLSLLRHGFALLLQFCYDAGNCRAAMNRGAFMYAVKLVKISPEFLQQTQMALICQAFLQNGALAIDIAEEEKNKPHVEEFISIVEQVLKRTTSKEMKETALYTVTSIAEAHKQKLSHLNNSCNTCGKANAPNRCSRCKKVKYCSRECQVKDWPKHKSHCDKL